MIANDPGLGNRYKFIGGRYHGKIGYWAGAGEDGVFVDWANGGQDCVRYGEWEDHAVFDEDQSPPSYDQICKP